MKTLEYGEPTSIPGDGESDEGDDDLVHSVCDCSPDVALCGKLVKDAEWVDGRRNFLECVVCVDLIKPVGCERCYARSVNDA